ncbi:MAG: hypothetical protein QW416_02815 [Candidatus Nitrosocaldaceae archaeon]
MDIASPSTGYNKHILYQNDTKFLIISRLDLLYKEFLDIMEEHYRYICNNILKIDGSMCVYLSNTSGDIVYGYQKEHSDVQKMLTSMDVNEDNVKIINTPITDFYVYKDKIKFSIDEYTITVLFKYIRDLDQIIKRLIDIISN